MAGGVDGHLLVKQALQFFAITEPVSEAFGDDGDTVGAAHCFAFEDGAFEDIGDALDGGGFAELLGDEGDGGAGGFSHSHGEEACVASHGDDDVPAAGGLGVFHEVGDKLAAEVSAVL